MMRHPWVTQIPLAIKQILSSPIREEENPLRPTMTFNPTSPQPCQALTGGACPGRNSERGTWSGCALPPDGVLWAGTVDLTSATLRSWWPSDLFLPSTRNSEQETTFLWSKSATKHQIINQHHSFVLFPLSLTYIRETLHNTSRDFWGLVENSHKDILRDLCLSWD